MSSKAKNGDVSASRFCTRALELPYADLYRHSPFTLAISKLSLHQSWPRVATSEQPIALGVLHGSATFSDHPVQEPVLPVQLTFGSSPSSPDRLGTAHLASPSGDEPYMLLVEINDRSGEILQAFNVAFQKAVVSGCASVLIRCSRNREPQKPSATMSEISAKMEADRHFLRRVEAGEAELEPIPFDRIHFEEALLTRAPDWTWAWEEMNFRQPRFLSQATETWRREWLHAQGTPRVRSILSSD